MKQKIAELNTKKQTNITIINNNVPTIINNLDTIEDINCINLLKKIRDKITNEQYKNAISNKINQLAGKIVSSFTVPNKNEKILDLSDLNTNSRVERYMILNGQ